MTTPPHHRSPVERFVAVEPDVDLRVLYTAGDAPGATPFVLVHGLASNARLWDGTAAALAAAGHTVAAVDLRGHGQSSKPDHGYDFATLVDDLVALITSLGLHRPLVVGQSWGGMLAMDWALDPRPGLNAP